MKFWLDIVVIVVVDGGGGGRRSRHGVRSLHAKSSICVGYLFCCCCVS